MIDKVVVWFSGQQKLTEGSPIDFFCPAALYLTLNLISLFG